MIIFLHGLGSSSASFEVLQSMSASQGEVFWSPECPGHARALETLWEGDPLESMARFVLSKIDTMNDKVVLVGHSMGGALASLILRQAPNRIAAWISIEGNLIGEDCGILSRRLANAPFEEIKAIKADLIKNFSAARSDSWRQWANDVNRMRADTVKAYASSLVSLSDSGSVLEAFHQFDGPKAYIHGDDYVGAPILKKLGTIPVFHANGTGHFVMQDDPVFCATAINKVIR